MSKATYTADHRYEITLRATDQHGNPIVKFVEADYIHRTDKMDITFYLRGQSSGTMNTVTASGFNSVVSTTSEEVAGFPSAAYLSYVRIR